jgi:ABC-type transport system substrate-binding protein
MSCAPNVARIGPDAEPPPPQKEHVKHTPKEDKRGDKHAETPQLPRPDDSGDDTPEWFAMVDHRPGFEEERAEEAARREEERFPDVFGREEPRPVVGGKARMYLQRGFMDDAVSEMVRLDPFGADGSQRKIFTVTDSTHRRLELKLAGDIRRGDGRRATALDFVELWSRFLKARPAQGLALFRYVQGAEAFINGKEPLVSGFNAADEQTIRIRFAKPDPLAFQRLSSPKLIGGPFMLGSYYSSAAKGGEYKLLPNANSPSEEAAYLKECLVQAGGDDDPLSSFSLGKYSAMAVYAKTDMEAAKTELRGKASIGRLPSDRYFLSCKVDDPQVRKFVRVSVNGADLLNSVVGAEGEEIYGVAERIETMETPRGYVPVPQMPKPFRIIYRGDDPISKTVAVKISADMEEAGLKTALKEGNAEVYERALVSGDYDCAVGWVSESVLNNLTEQLHLASMWFADDTDSRARLRDYREIPLFSVNNYILLREDLRLYKDRLSGIWIDSGAR